MERFVTLALLAAFLFCSHGIAAIRLEIVSFSVSEDGMPAVISLEAWVDGKKGRFEFRELGDLLQLTAAPLSEVFPECDRARKSLPSSDDEAWDDAEDEDAEGYNALGNTLWGPGSFLLTTDGGKSVVIVNAPARAYFDWNMSQSMPLFGALVGAIQQGTSTSFGAPVVKGPDLIGTEEVAGVQTKHYRYESGFVSTSRILGMNIQVSSNSEQELWVTDAVNGEALSVYLKKDPPLTGNPQIDRLLMTELENIPGWPLKAILINSTSSGPGSESVTCSKQWVTSVATGEAPAGVFEIPEGYEKKELSISSLFE